MKGLRVTEVILQSATSRTKPVIGRATVVLNDALTIPNFEVWQRVPGYRISVHAPTVFGDVTAPAVKMMQDAVRTAWHAKTGDPI